ncbi:MAG TPA: hypothetical protein ENJ28_05230 [Gammaproteobacteria bacterium]|nr:hypothetical protein [Gammaproteobacteria bacterium]
MTYLQGIHKSLLSICFITSIFALSSPAFAKDPESFRDLMKYMGEEYTKVAEGILKQDYKQLSEAANNIAFHPEPPLTQRMKIIAKLGTNFMDFKSWDDEVHLSAVALTKAAKDKNNAEILKHNAMMLKKCTSCHDKYRDLVKTLRIK